MTKAQSQMEKRQKIICPECDNPLILNENTKAHEIVECPACGTESEIINLDPIALAPLEEEK